MPEITLLSQETIDKIAAGEVVERPSSVVKELVENAIDAKATAVTVEIKEGGISFIRITDNGCGIGHDQVPIAFVRHSTSKIKSIGDLMCVTSLGFRGEALSSIAAVAQVELITKTYGEVTGTRYVIEGSQEKEYEEIGAPDGTTFLVRNLFYNTPARRKFLKTAQTEGTYVSDLIDRLALSHPDVSFKFINNGQTKLHTSGNSNEKDMIYHIYGRDITSALLPVNEKTDFFSIRGFVGKPVISRGNRNYENYFINGRYIKSTLLSKTIEEAYKGLMLQHQYPFCVLYLTMDTELIDVNVHPTKMELRFSNSEEIYRKLYQIIRDVLTHTEMIPDVPVEEKKSAAGLVPAPVPVRTPEPFEKGQKEPAADRRMAENESVFQKLLAKTQEQEQTQRQEQEIADPPLPAQIQEENAYMQESFLTNGTESAFLTKDAVKKHQIIGQLFQTYWLVEYEDKLFIIDQHAAHEKVLYERTMERMKKKEFSSQALSPPIILTLDAGEVEMLERYKKQIEAFGYRVEHFGGREYALDAIPADFAEVNMQSMFLEMLEDFSGIGERETPERILEKVASMSCKAAVKGHHRLSRQEMEKLVDDLLSLENPYHCPHGRPTIISMSRYEIEKKFKRIV